MSDKHEFMIKWATSPSMTELFFAKFVFKSSVPAEWFTFLKFISLESFGKFSLNEDFHSICPWFERSGVNFRRRKLICALLKSQWEVRG